MATLSTDVAIEFDGNIPPSLAQVKGEAIDTYYRGGLAHHTAGLLQLTPTAGEFFAGVIWGRPDPNPIAANDLVWIAVTGRFHWACVDATDANYETCFAMPAADLTDNPASLLTIAVGAAGAVGTLDHVTSTAVSGWFNISRRTTTSNI